MIADRLLMPAHRSFRFCVVALFLALSCLTSRAVLVAWDANPPSEGVEGYRIYYSLNGVTYGPIPAGNFTTGALPNLIPGSTYTIWVTAFNAAGESDPSASIQYTPPAGTAPTISVQPSGQNLTVGNTINLDVDANGTAPLRYDWFRNNTAVTGVNSDILNIPNAQIANSGNYLVRISNPIGAVTSVVAVVNITAAPVPPSITAQPQNLTITEGAEARFSVTATGTAPLSYQWRNSSGNISGANGSVYTISPAQVSDSGTFSVRVSNGAGFVDSANVTLNVVPISSATAPTITTQPSNLTAFEGETTSLAVDVTGTAPFSYQWYKDNVAVLDETNSAFSFLPIELGDAGSYFVIVANAAGSATSVVAQVSVSPPPDDFPPIIVEHPDSRTVTAGSIVEFSVEAISVGPLSYQWYKNNLPIAGATQNPFRIEAASVSDSGEYSVYVSNAAGLEISQTAVLQVNAAPTILNNPVDVTVAINGRATFSAGASGSGSISYQWYKGSTQISGATGPSFSIESAQLSDEGSYSVRISDGSGISFSAPGHLRVVTPPVVVTPPANLRIAEGLRAEFTVEASPDGVSYQWFKDGRAISGATGRFLVLSPVAYSDSGEYAVRVSNIAGQAVSASALLEIAGAPRISAQMVGGTAHEGTPFSFSVQAAGAGPLEYKWFRNGSEIPGATGSTLTLTSPRKTDEGSYWVKIQNSFGTVTGTAAELQVIERPVITEHPASARVREGNSVTLRVVAQGSGPIQVQWYKNGNPLPAEQSANLLISAAQVSDAGAYHAIVANVAGPVVSQSVTVSVLTLPQIVEQPESSEIAEGQPLTLAVLADGSGPLSYQWFKNEELIPGADGDVLNVEQSTPETAGSYTVLVSNEAGSVISEAAVVTINTAPRVVTEAESTTVNEGSRSSFSLQVEVSGSGPLEFQWFKGEEMVPGATSAVLTFPTVQRTDAGTYRLRVTNPVGTAFSEPVVLTVLIAPVITLQPVGGTILENSSLQLAVEATGSAPLEFQWFHNGVAIAGATGQTLDRGPASGGHAGIYSVRVANSAGSVVSQAAEVIVISPPKILSQSADQTVEKGGTVKLSAKAAGTGPLTYQWYKDGGPIFGATTANLLLFGADPSDSGVYTLFVMSPHGTNKTSGIAVTVTTSQGGSNGSTTTQPGALSIKSSGGKFFLSSNGSNGEVFTLQSCADLSQPIWGDIATAIMSSSGAIEFEAGSVIPEGTRFFRLTKQ